MTLKPLYILVLTALQCLQGSAQTTPYYIPLINANKILLCEKDTLKLTIDDAYLSNSSPITASGIIMQNRCYCAGAGMCSYATPPHYFDYTGVFPIVSGPNIISVDTIITGSPCGNPVYRIVIKAKPSNDAVYTVLWQAQTTYYNDPNYPNNTTTTRIYDGHINVSVLHLTTPTIKANKILILANEQATLTALPQAPGTGYYQWRTNCPGDTWNYANNNPIQVPPGSYLARYTQNGCFSDSSAPIAILRETASPTSLGCLNSKAQYIYDFTRNGDDGRSDYHAYDVETVICNTSAGNCTLNDVWLKMKSSVWNNAPLAGDLSMYGGYRPPVIFSKMLFKSPESPVINCASVSLPDPVTISIVVSGLSGIDLSSVSAFRNYYNSYINYTAIANTDANPIIQTFDEASKTITNYTMPGHIFYPGRVTRTVVQECGVIKIRTAGVGRSWAWDYSNTAGKFLSDLNVREGIKLFTNIDLRIKNFY